MFSKPKIETLPLNKPLCFANGNKLFFTSNTHFDNVNSDQCHGYPFASVEEMNQRLIENWNSEVGKEDIIFHIGGFAMGGDWSRWLDQLNGRIYLIPAPSDRPYLYQDVRERFELIARQATIEVEGRKILLHHNPLYCYPDSTGKNEELVFHFHGNEQTPLEPQCNNTQETIYQMHIKRNVAQDRHYFKPVSFKEINEDICMSLDYPHCIY